MVSIYWNCLFTRKRPKYCVFGQTIFRFFVDCKGKVCFNGGTFDISTCSCKCWPLYGGPQCETSRFTIYHLLLFVLVYTRIYLRFKHVVLCTQLCYLGCLSKRSELVGFVTYQPVGRWLSHCAIGDDVLLFVINFVLKSGAHFICLSRWYLIKSLCWLSVTENFQLG